jgi:hypothetical protein
MSLTLKHQSYPFIWYNFLTLEKNRNEDFKYGVVVV